MAAKDRTRGEEALAEGGKQLGRVAVNGAAQERDDRVGVHSRLHRRRLDVLPHRLVPHDADVLGEAHSASGEGPPDGLRNSTNCFFLRE